MGGRRDRVKLIVCERVRHTQRERGKDDYVAFLVPPETYFLYFIGLKCLAFVFCWLAIRWHGVCSALFS